MEVSGIPSDLLQILAGNKGGVVSVRDYVEMLRTDDWEDHKVDYPVVARRLGIVIFKPPKHRIALAILGACTQLLDSGEVLSVPVKEYWIDLRDRCTSDEIQCSALCRHFIISGGYYFSRKYGRGLSFLPVCTCKNGRHMDEADEEIIEGLHCKDFDYPHG